MNKQTGFTLVEVVVVVGLVGLLAAFGVGIFIANNRFYQNQTGEIQAISGTRLIADRINQYARSAVNFEASIVYNSVTYTTNATTVVMKLPAIDASSQIIAGAYDYAIVTRDPNNAQRLMLFISPDAASARLALDSELTDKLSVVNFTYDDATPSQAVNMTYQVKIDTGGRSPGIEDLRGGVTLRNK